MPLNTLQRTGQVPTTQSYPAPNTNSTEAEKLWCRHTNGTQNTVSIHTSLPGRHQERVETPALHACPSSPAAVAAVLNCVIIMLMRVLCVHTPHNKGMIITDWSH